MKNSVSSRILKENYELGNEDNTRVVLHELGNMAMLMDFSIKKIEETYKDIENYEYFKFLKEDTKQLIALIGKAKDETKIYNINKEETDIVELVDELILKYKIRCLDSNIEINLNINPEISNSKIINADRFKLSRVIENIIINSIEELEQCNNIDKNINITVEKGRNEIYTGNNIDETAGEKGCIVTHKSSNGDMIVIKINNNGRIIEEENIEKIFNPYYTSKDNGSGIGLALCNKIVKLHKGNIKVVSNIESGTTFSIRLPYESGK